jgi:hypothetical protein
MIFATELTEFCRIQSNKLAQNHPHDSANSAFAKNKKGEANDLAWKLTGEN